MIHRFFGRERFSNIRFEEDDVRRTSHRLDILATDSALHTFKVVLFPDIGISICSLPKIYARFA